MHDVIIVGFGLAGASLAACFARDGLQVLCIDRDEAVRDSFKGELLQPGGVRALERLGLSSCLDAASVDAVTVEGYVVLPAVGGGGGGGGGDGGGGGGGGGVRLAYPPRDPATFLEQLLGPAAQAVADPARAPRGRSFHNKRLVEALRGEALRAGASVAWGECTALLEEGGRAAGVRWAPRDAAAAEARGAMVVVCDGMFSTLRGAVRARGAAAPETLSHFAGLLLRHAPGRPPLPAPGHGHVVLVTPSPVLFYQISSSETRCLVDLPPHAGASEAALARYLEATVAPQLPGGLRGAFLAALREAPAGAAAALRTAPCKALARGARAPALAGVVLLGDAASMRHPLTGGGMTVALGDVERLWRARRAAAAAAAAAAHAPRGGRGAGDALRAAAAAFHRQRRGFTISVLANALHAVFTAPEGGGARDELRAACLAYLGRGGACAAGPIGLLAGLSPSPWVLLLHFFAVACCAGLRGVATGCRILLPILWREVWA
jgi:squalene monooxygenase